MFLTSERTRKAFLGKHAKALVDGTSEDVARIYERIGLTIPVQTSSTLQTLNTHDGLALADMARIIAIPHQLAAQRVKKLVALDIVTTQPDPNDARRKIFTLTDFGRRQAQLLKDCMDNMAVIYERLYAEIECDLAQKLLDALASIQNKPLDDRYAELFIKEDNNA